MLIQKVVEVLSTETHYVRLRTWIQSLELISTKATKFLDEICMRKPKIHASRHITCPQEQRCYCIEFWYYCRGRHGRNPDFREVPSYLSSWAIIDRDMYGIEKSGKQQYDHLTQYAKHGSTLPTQSPHFIWAVFFLLVLFLQMIDRSTLVAKIFEYLTCTIPRCTQFSAQ